jgi:peptidoglycan/xylan/chitin deacetylase (PgdA/CDA1 family)
MSAQILPILCYHNISDGDNSNSLFVSTNVLLAQLQFLKKKGYATISIQQLLQYWQSGTALPAKPVLLTFDDGYKTMATHLYPMLQQYHAKATVFLLPGFVHQQNTSYNTYLSIAEIKNISNQWLEWGIHSYDHKNFKKLTPVAVQEDLKRCAAWFNQNNIPFVQAFAFPFGSFPKKNIFKRIPFFKAVAAAGIKISFRLGNRLNYLTAKRPVMLQRIDITGNETMQQFEKYLTRGKKKNIRQWLG